MKIPVWELVVSKFLRNQRTVFRQEFGDDKFISKNIKVFSKFDDKRKRGFRETPYFYNKYRSKNNKL